jgi:cell division protein FtsB
MNIELLVTITGSFISLLLMVNAYFTRETLLRVVKIEVELTKNITKQSYLEKQVDNNTREIQNLRDFKHRHENDYKNIVEILQKEN